MINYPPESASVLHSRNYVLASPLKASVKAKVKSYGLLIHLRFQKYCECGGQEHTLQVLWHDMYIYPTKVMEVHFSSAFF